MSHKTEHDEWIEIKLPAGGLQQEPIVEIVSVIGEKIYKCLLARATESAVVTTVDNGDGTFTHTFDFTKDAE